MESGKWKIESSGRLYILSKEFRENQRVIFVQTSAFRPSTFFLSSDLHSHDLFICADEFIANLQAELEIKIGGLQRDDCFV